MLPQNKDSSDINGQDIEFEYTPQIFYSTSSFLFSEYMFYLDATHGIQIMQATDNFDIHHG